VCRLFPEKGTTHLLDAFRMVALRFPDTVLVVVGDGPLRRQLQEQARRLKIEGQVVFTGYLREVALTMAAFDILAFTSTGVEAGSPLPVLEAMALGKAIVSTDVVEVIEDGQTGLLVPTEDPRALARGITRLLENPGEAERLAGCARANAPRYEVGNYVQELDRIYQSLLMNRLVESGKNRLHEFR
jgi:glycosyltransferase involved in cell wall biosynthesis